VIVNNQAPSCCVNIIGAFTIAGSDTPVTPEESTTNAGGIDIVTLPSANETISIRPSTPTRAVKPDPLINHRYSGALFGGTDNTTASFTDPDVTSYTKSLPSPAAPEYVARLPRDFNEEAFAPNKLIDKLTPLRVTLNKSSESPLAANLGDNGLRSTRPPPSTVGVTTVPTSVHDPSDN
jgi:hypothetical protein